jgi:hypothetical protein
MTDGTKGAERSGDRPDHLLDDEDSRSTEAELREFADLDQITYYLQGRLPPDEAAASPYHRASAGNQGHDRPPIYSEALHEP